MHEFELIDRYLAPLATHKNALSLQDDAALLNHAPTQEFVVSVDALVEGKHFLPNAEPAKLAKKVLSVNLSDIAAMGAIPYGYFLTLMLPKVPSEDWMKSFSDGLKGMQKKHKISLLGGDTVATDGPFAFSVTIIGKVTKSQAIKRSGACAGHDIYVSGQIGKGALGLKAAKGEIENEAVLAYHETPTARLGLGKSLTFIKASAAIDVSDGLLADLKHICKASGAAAVIEKDKLPICADAPLDWRDAVTGGDDYELCFTAPQKQYEEIIALGKSLGLPITRIGKMVQANVWDVKIVDESGKEIAVEREGFKHF